MATRLTICTECGKPFEKRTADFNRTERGGKGHFCNRACSVIWGNKHVKRAHRTDQLISGNRLDELSPFRGFMLTARMHSKQSSETRECTITPQYLQALWNRQDGRCGFTGWKLLLLQRCGKWEPGPAHLRASLDRIDNTRGYVPDNVRFVCVMINYAKNRFSEQVLGEFIAAVSQQHMRSRCQVGSIQ